MLEASPDALVVVGEDGVIESATAAVEILFGYTPVEIVGQAVEVLIPMHLGDVHRSYRASFGQHPQVRLMGVGLDLRGVRRDGTEFPVDVSLVPSQAGDRLHVGAFVRDATERRRGEDLLRYVNEISRAVLAGGPTQELLTLAAARARVLAGAVVAWVAVSQAEGQEILVAAADGAASGHLVGATTPTVGSLAARAMATGTTVAVSDMSDDPAVIAKARTVGLGPGLYLPMMAEEGAVGALVVARGSKAPEFTANEVATAEVFASAAAIVLALGAARQVVEDIRITSEHERIARDLHDTVIQRLFALGMRLQAAERLAQGPVVDRIRDTVDSIDEVIRDIRETIFDLNRPNPDGTDLRQRVRKEALTAADHLGFGPRVAFRGPVETTADERTTTQLVAVLREALSNVGRHAGASSVDVVVSVGDGFVTLTVSDDGVGISDEPTAGQGTTNMAARATELGGDLKLGRRTPSGTMLQWRVPANL